MPTVTVVAKVVAKRECLETVKAELLKLIAPTRKEEGCLEYTLHQDNSGPCRVHLLRELEQRGLPGRAHGERSFHFLCSAIDGMIEDKVVNKMTRIE